MIRRVGKNVGCTGATRRRPASSWSATATRWCAACSIRGVAALAAEIEQSFVERDAERGRTDREEFRYQMLNHGPARRRPSGTRRSWPPSSRCSATTATSSPTRRGATRPSSAAARGTATPGPTCRDPKASSGTTASRTRCSRSAPTSWSRTARSSADRRRSSRAATAPAGWRRATGSTTPTYVRRPCAGGARGGGRRCRPVRLRRLAPRHAGGRRRRPAVPPGALRPPRHRPADPHDDEVNHLSPEAIDERDDTAQRALVGLHDPYFYDG